MKNIKRLFLLLNIILLVFILCTSSCYALDISNVITGMKDAQNMDGTMKQDSGVGKVLNDAIGILQFVGTGVAVIMVTVLGAKYMLSSPDQKAEIKNRAMPVVIGAVILFAAVNLVAIVATFTSTALSVG